jgi:hypothetical protein
VSLYAWYVVNLNAIVIQVVVDGYIVLFEWGRTDLFIASMGNKIEPTDRDDLQWIPLGEI